MKNVLRLLFCVLLIVSCQKSVEESDDGVVLSIVSNNKQPLNKNIFGHFLEKCNWAGETGADVIWDLEQNMVCDDVIELIDSLHVPIIRFPGGTDIDYYQWTELIDNAYDRKDPKRPAYDGRNGNIVSQNKLGFDEFLKLAEQLNFEPLLVVNLGDAYFEKTSVEEAADYAAALVAYCNASITDNLPEKYLKWARLREKNGRKEPYDVPYFQIGNEVWMFEKEIDRNVNPVKENISNRYISIVETYIDAMRSVDPSIKIIAEGNSEGLVIPTKNQLGSKVDMMAYHHYQPWGMNYAVNTSGDTLNNISEKDFYYAMVSVPDFDSKTGLSDFHDANFRTLLKSGMPIAVTEWNWNGWVGGAFEESGLKDSKLAQGLGSASMLHAMMRHSDVVKMGNQSMLAGNSWGINSIRVDKKTNEAVLFPTGLTTGLYAAHHGNQIVESHLDNQEFYDQPYRNIGVLTSKSNVAYLDIVVSENEDNYFIHVINRDFTNKRTITLASNSFKTKIDYVHHEISGDVFGKGKPEAAKIYNFSKSLKFLDKKNVLEVNPHSVSVFQIHKE